MQSMQRRFRSGVCTLRKGFLGLECFKHFMNDDRWDGIPMVLETPDGEKGYPKELKALRSLVRP